MGALMDREFIASELVKVARDLVAVNKRELARAKKQYENIVKALRKTKAPVTVAFYGSPDYWDPGRIDIILGSYAPDRVSNQVHKAIRRYDGKNVDIMGSSSEYDHRQYSDYTHVNGGAPAVWE
jgi:hypothetical protein